MPFELSVASKYLLPRWRQLSVSLISLVSVCVIALVVWLILVFFSVSRGLEKNWIQQLIALTAPVRITPTEQYYESYYYQVDQYSDTSDYQAKNFQGKLDAEDVDPYDPSYDPPLPEFVPEPFKRDGELVDIVGEAFAAIEEVGPQWKAAPFEMSRGNLRLRQLRDSGQQIAQRTTEQPSYVVSFSDQNPLLDRAVVPMDKQDLANLIWIAGISEEGILEENLSSISREEQALVEKRLEAIFTHVELKSLTVGSQEWRVPLEGFMLSPGTELQVIGKPTARGIPVQFSRDGVGYELSVSLSGLELGDVSWTTHFEEEPASTPPWLHFVQELPRLPDNELFGEGMLLAKHFKEEADARIGDRGSLSYFAITPSGLQEQRTPFTVAGFYDPGIIPIGGKFVMISEEAVSAIRVAQAESEVPDQGGIHIWFPEVKQAAQAKKALQQAFDARGLTPYFTIQTYEEYDFTKELIQQLSSEQNLFSLISLIIIVVACSNIVTLLILLVNDKRLEIGILRSMGATSTSIAIIFGTCGMVMGGIGALVGALAAMLTLIYLNPIIGFLSWIQGYELFNTTIYGKILPNELSYEVLGVVLGVTVFLSLLSGIIPALKASLMNPSNILRS